MSTKRPTIKEFIFVIETLGEISMSAKLMNKYGSDFDATIAAE